jgi:ABC-type Fe3+-siderophore transport system permease subunit
MIAVTGIQAGIAFGAVVICVLAAVSILYYRKIGTKIEDHTYIALGWIGGITFMILLDLIMSR